MWAFSGGMLMTGVLLGFIWRRNQALETKYARYWFWTLAATLMTVVLAAVSPLGWLKFSLVVLQAPLVGLAIATIPRKTTGIEG